MSILKPFTIFFIICFLTAIGYTKAGIDNINIKKMLDGEYKDKFLKVTCKSIPEKYIAEITQIGDTPTPAFSADGSGVKNRFEVILSDKDGKKIIPAFEVESLFFSRDFQFISTNPELTIMSGVLDSKGLMWGTYQSVFECSMSPVGTTTFHPVPLVAPDEPICKNPSPEDECTID